jgi:hypothetical protein
MLGRLAMAAPIHSTARLIAHSTTMPILAVLLALAFAPGAALAGEPDHAGNRGGWRGGSHPAPNAPRPAPQGARGGGAMPAARPAYAPQAAAPAWHNAPPVRGGEATRGGGWTANAGGANWRGSGTAHGAHAPGYPVQPYAARGYPSGNTQAQRYQGQYGAAQGYAGRGAGYGERGYGGDRGYGGERGGRWNNGWRNDRRFDWVGWRGAHRDVFHPGYYYPPYGGYAYSRIGIGYMLDEAFLDERYWIEDPGTYHLPPVWGTYRWVRYYNDCLLIDIDTGQTVEVLYNVFW